MPLINNFVPANVMQKFEGTLGLGMLPVVPVSAHPSIVFRWDIRHITASSKDLQTDLWKPFIWVDAWVYMLFFNRSSMEIFTNAWTTVQENKPKVLELKTEYNKLLTSPRDRLIILAEARLKCGLEESVKMGLSMSHVARAVSANLAIVQTEVDELDERG